MKRGLSLITALVIFLMCSVTGFADVGGPNIKEFQAYVGLDGVTADYYTGSSEGHTTLPAGTKVNIFYQNDDGTYMFSTTIKNVNYSGIIAPDNFSTGKQLVAPYEGLDRSVIVYVTPKVGLNLRCGPSQNYPSFYTIPQNTKLEYVSVYSNEGMTWGYTRYKGQDGWVSLNYTTTSAPTAASTSQTSTTTTTRIVPVAPIAEETTSQTTTEPTEEPIVETSDAAIVIFIVVAVLLALTAVVLVLYVVNSKKRNNPPIANAAPPTNYYPPRTDNNYNNNYYNNYNNRNNYDSSEVMTQPFSDQGMNNSVVCPNCGTVMKNTDTFCLQCGCRLTK